MSKRNRNCCKRVLIVGAASIFMLLGTWLSPERSFGQSATQSVYSIKGWSCVKGKDYLRDNQGRPVWLNSSALLERVIDKQPVKRPALLGKNNLQGDVIVQVLINKDGKVECARGVKGHPLAISSAIDSVPKWVFKPYAVNNEPKSILGILTIAYDFRTIR